MQDLSSQHDLGVSVVVPVYEEAATVVELVTRLERLDLVRQIILVDDGSSRETAELLDALPTDHKSTLVRHARNQGKGAALRTGFAACREPVVVVQDADLEYVPEDLPRLVAPIAAGVADVVYGTRYHEAADETGRRAFRAANWFLTGLSNRLTGLQLSDMETGHKAFRKEVLDSIEIVEDRFGVEPELTAKIARGNWRVAETPIRYYPRTRAEGKKIGVRDGLRAVWCLWRYSRPVRRTQCGVAPRPACSHER